MANIGRRLVFKSLQMCFILLWHTKLDFFISKFIGIVTVAYNKKEFSKNKNKKAILAMERGVFDYDVKAIKEYPSNYIIVIYPTLARALLSDEAEWLIPEEILEQTAFYKNKDKYTWLYDRFSKIYTKALDTMNAFGNIDVKIVLTANIDYFQDYPWIKAIHNKNGKFVVLEKESIVYLYTDKKTISARHKKYDFKFEGDAVFFYNYLGRDTYVEAGSVKPSQAHVTGCPRVDSLIEILNKKTKKQDIAVVATFMQPYYFATKVWDEIINSIYSDELLRKKTIIKCKDKSEVTEVNSKFPGINAVCDSLGKYLVKNPTIFVGYNSTACYDALIAGITLMIPFWGETHKQGNDALVGKHTSNFHHLAKNKSEFIRILKDYIKGDTANYKKFGNVFDDKKLKEFLEQRYSRVDGNNCKRFYEKIDKILK